MSKNLLRAIMALIVIAVIIKTVPPVNTFARTYFPRIVLNWLAEDPIVVQTEDTTVEPTIQSAPQPPN